MLSKEIGCRARIVTSCLATSGTSRIVVIRIFSSEVCARSAVVSALVVRSKKAFRCFSVLNYIVTCNDIHLLIKDTGSNVIADSMQLIAGRTGQEYNQRKARHGAFWEDRYHATAIEADEHLQRCLVYIDLNMVRARVVSHPSNWAHSGYWEIQNPPKRYAIIDLPELSSLCGFNGVTDFQQAHRQWVTAALSESVVREGRRRLRSAISILLRR